jgi:hypothetical protein
VGTNTEPAVHAEHRDLVRTLDWRRPLGELFLIVAGVLLALAVNNWNTGWQNRATELALLQQLRSALVNDLSNLNDAQNGFRSRKKRIEVLRDDVKRGRAYEDSMASDFGIVLGIWPIHFNRGPYEVLKGRGLDLISNDAIRLRIVRVYDQTYAEYQGSQEDDRNVVFEVVRPYYLKAFREIRIRESATPLKYDELLRDSFFRNVLDYRLQSLELNSIGPADAATNEVSALLKDLDNEISHRQ